MSDPFDELRQAWRSLEAPPELRAEPHDEATRAAVEWMRSAWRETSPPPLPSPWRSSAPEFNGATGERFPWGALASAAAAALIALIGWAGSFDSRAPAPSPAGDTALARAPEPVQIVTATPERIEMRSGAVTLVLLNPSDNR